MSTPPSRPVLPWIPQRRALGLAAGLTLTASLAACSATIGEPGEEGAGPQGAAAGEGSPGLDFSGGPLGERRETDVTVEPGSDAPIDTVTVVEREGFAPAERVVRRLTKEEYSYTVLDTLGVSLPASELDALPMDRPLEGFVNIATSQAANPTHVRGWNELASSVVSRIDWSAFLGEHASCTETTAECERGFVDSAGKLLFRRPPTAGESDRFVALFDAVVGHGAGFRRGAEAVMEAMLQSPQFLYLLEVEKAGVSGLRAVKGFELASRLSYFLWASAPDAELRAAASDGSLDASAGVEAQLSRMLADPKARRVSRRFLVDWARLESLPDDDGLKQQLIASATAFYQHQLWESEQPYFDLFAAPTAFLTPKLAQAYGLESAGSGIQQYDITGLPDRLGLLSQPGVVAGMTNADGGAIVARGLFLSAQLFCGEVPDPPDTLQGEIDAFVEALPPDASDRMIAETRLQREECANCHAQFDPLAYAFERFDHRGAFRDVDEHGNSLSTDGWIPASLTASGEQRPYASIEAYMTALADMPRVRTCLTRKHVEYAIGARLDARHRASIREVLETFAGKDGSYRALVRAIVLNDIFSVIASQ